MMFRLLLRSNKNREQKKSDAGGESRSGARQPPPHPEGLQCGNDRRCKCIDVDEMIPNSSSVCSDG